MTLTEFLLARIEHDKRFFATYGVEEEHRVQLLAECEAKRKIVEHAIAWSATLHEVPEGWSEGTTTAYRMAMEWTLCCLALPYADHPDYAEATTA